MAAILKHALNSVQIKFIFAVALYQIFITTLKTTFPPNFVFLTESEQFQHISAPLLVFLDPTTSDSDSSFC